MRWLLRILRTRVGAALGLILLIAAAITVGKLAGSGQNVPIQRSEPIPIDTARPTGPDDGVADLTASTRPDDRVPLSLANQFARAWLRKDLSASEWHATIRPMVTESLAADLEGVDPRTVPASRRVGDTKILLLDQSYVRIAVPMDTGTLLLKIFKADEGWLVGEIDWEQA
jgi:hypothetical protein